MEERTCKVTEIDPSKVNLVEKDIEDWLWENPKSVHTNKGTVVERWVARQYAVPSGIIDLLGTDGDDDYVVVEVKNVTIDSGALTQVCRYATDIREIISNIDEYCLCDIAVEKVVIGQGPVSNKIIFEGDALDISLLTFEVKLSLDVSGRWGWTSEYTGAICKNYEKLSKDEVFNDARNKVMQAMEEHNLIRPEDLNESSVVEEAMRIINEDADITDDEEE